jgi:hypothetical protein
MDPVTYYTKKRQDDANYLSTSEENKGLVKGEKIKVKNGVIKNG